MSEEKLPDEIYQRVISTIRTYDIRKEQYENIPTDGESVGYVKANKQGVSDITGKKGIKRAILANEIEAIDKSMSMIPPDYRQGVLEKIKHGTKYPQNVTRNTYTNYKRKLIFDIAVELGLLQEKTE